ncbi:putative membrane-anchored protein [Paenibacillus turicensis]|uniref:Membrane-anchored protein n=1 Tax=Paenibacillus turicensis TaxID=160487 RepID=A0ABS4FY59_9BACL|nr:putative membrane-anchored protein [Paenibacillus turicensis]
MINKQRFRFGALSLMIAVLLTTLLPAPSFATNEDGATNNTQQENPLANLNWIEGQGQSIDVGTALAQLKLPKGYYFLDEKDSIVYLKETGNIPNGREIGTILPEDMSWSLFLEYEDTGHIKDEEKSDIDASALLDSYRKGTEESNKQLDAKYHLNVLGWHAEPHYDESIHSLTWATLLQDAEHNKLVNYNTRILTREGTISTILVSSPDTLDKDSAIVQKDIIENFSLKDGNKYTDFNPDTDKAAAYGLTGLILGGAGAVVAKKTGLLALILAFLKKGFVLIIAAFAWLGKVIFGKKKKQDNNPNVMSDVQEPAISETTTETKSESDDRFNQSDDRFNSDNRFK